MSLLHSQSVTIESHPLFFDSLFPSFQSTTPETVVSDYRQRKRADSRAEHETGHDDTSNGGETKVNVENNVEFYAEVIGKLVGTIRDGVSSFISDLKQRNLPKPDESEMKIAKLKNQQFKHASLDMNMMGMHQTQNETNTQNSHESTSASTKKIASIDLKEHQEIKLTTLMAKRDDASESNEKEEREIQSQTESMPVERNNVVQVIARRSKQKRSEESSHQRIEKHDNDGMNVEQLRIPIDSDGEMTNERTTTGNSDDDEQEIEITSDDVSWFERHQNLLSNLSANHRRRKAKLINFIHHFTKSNSLNHTADNVTSSDSKHSFAIMRGNSTIVHLTPLQFLRTFHRGSNEHAQLQQKTKTTLQRAFYKYARLYLFARKGYKDARSYNRMVNEHHHENYEELLPLPPPLSLEQKELDESSNFIKDEEVEGFAANSARANLQTMEAFAILVLEIFGAMFGLALGAVAQMQASNLFEGL